MKNTLIAAAFAVALPAGVAFAQEGEQAPTRFETCSSVPDTTAQFCRVAGDEPVATFTAPDGQSVGLYEGRIDMDGQSYEVCQVPMITKEDGTLEVHPLAAYGGGIRCEP